jgi:hypothetical protein
MDTTVTAMFPNQQMALMATASLAQSGLRSEQVRLVSAATADRHDFIERETSDSGRGTILGVSLGVVAGAWAGFALGDVFGWLPAIAVGVLLGGLGGAVLGQTVGRVTRNEVQTQVEEEVDAGTVLVSVETDGEHAVKILGLLEVAGGRAMVTTATSYTVGVAAHPGSPSQE